MVNKSIVSNDTYNKWEYTGTHKNKKTQKNHKFKAWILKAKGKQVKNHGCVPV